jgi:hypothetical protein
VILGIHRFKSHGGFFVLMLTTTCGVILYGACFLLIIFLFPAGRLWAYFLAIEFISFSDFSPAELTSEILLDQNVNNP